MLPQATNCWEDSWEVLYETQLSLMIRLDEEKYRKWQEFQILCKLVVDKVIPRLLSPLESEGREIKLCPLHGDL
ncbi:putative protein-ribulosamine 3- chloroplastic [Rosellinia necatrix]|uniref:Uncharacterized protein n=1 Tax=Rosellinia necatrix TaxID=77044 RepID=A0A1S8A4V6_ROSNE|nr:putative protein-ribulosamine 3- chloroplastic [Rosellinia necatrix]